jgi:hypothetical protein
VCQAELSHYNFILVVGEKEKTSGSVNIRNRDKIFLGKIAVDEFVNLISRLTKERLMDSTILIVKGNKKIHTDDSSNIMIDVVSYILKKNVLSLQTNDCKESLVSV